MSRHLKLLAGLSVIGACGCSWDGPLTRSLSPSLRRPGPDGLYASVLLTTDPANETRFDVSGRMRIAFAATHDDNVDIWLRSADPRVVEDPRRLTFHSAADDSPAFSPDGKRLAFVTRRDDTRGDIAVMGASGAGMRIITDRKGADRDPCWAPDGKRIAFARTHASGGAEEVYELSLRNPVPQRLTVGGGRGPCYSPDGRYLCYSSVKDDPSGSIWVMRLEDQAAAALTSGPAIDGFPTWSGDGKWVYFARFSEDTNQDGEVTTQDNASIWRAEFAGMDTAARAHEVQLTSGRFYDLYPRVRKGLLYYATNEQGNFDIAVVNSEGFSPNPPTAEAALAMARRTLAAAPPSPYTSILVLRRILSDPPADIKSDTARQNLFADVLLEIAKQYAGLNLRQHAMEALARLRASCPRARNQVHEATIRLQAYQAAIAQQELSQELRQQGLASAVKALEQIGRAATLTSHTQALAWVTAGDIYNAARQPERAVRCYEQLFDDNGSPRFPEAANLTAEAAIRKVDSSLRLTGRDTDSARQKKLYWDIIDHYPRARGVCLRAARVILDLELEGREFDHERLRQIISEFRNQPLLAAMAQNRLADLYYRQRRIANAKHEYEKVAKGTLYPKEAEQIAAAKFALAHIHYEQQQYKECLRIYGLLTEQERQGNLEIFSLARRAYIRSTLDKARREFRLRDVSVALKTYRELMDLDWSLVVPQEQEKGERGKRAETFTAFDWKLVEAHRGYIECHAEVDRVAKKKGLRAQMIPKAIRFYERQVVLARELQQNLDQGRSQLAYGERELPMLHKGLTNAHAVAYYGMGLALTYVDKHTAAEHKIAKAANLEPRAPYFHQTIGWICEQRYRKSGDSTWLQKALARYERALSLLDKEEDPQAYANLLLNLGNTCRQLSNNWNKAYEYYEARERMDPECKWLLHVQTKALFYRNYGNAATRKPEPDYRKAIELCGKALAAFDELLAALEAKLKEASTGKAANAAAASRYRGDIEKFRRHRADIWATKGMSHQMVREHTEAVAAFRQAHKAYVQLRDREKARLHLRNVAYNTFKLGQSEPARAKKLPLLDQARTSFEGALPGAPRASERGGAR